MPKPTKISKATRNRRLLKLAAFLRTIPRRRFNYNRWVGDDWAGKPDLSCGTEACALGWAATIPAFRKLGLRLDMEQLTFYRQGRVVLGTIRKGRRVIEGTEAAERVFGLTHQEATYLFVPYTTLENQGESQATPKYVARKIERFVATGVVPPGHVG